MARPRHDLPPWHPLFSADLADYNSSLSRKGSGLIALMEALDEMERARPTGLDVPIRRRARPNGQAQTKQEAEMDEGIPFYRFMSRHLKAKSTSVDGLRSKQFVETLAGSPTQRKSTDRRARPIGYVVPAEDAGADAP